MFQYISYHTLPAVETVGYAENWNRNKNYMYSHSQRFQPLEKM
jgi:hypothetical protein